MRFTKTLIATLIASASLAAVAGPTCTQEAKTKWMSEDAFKKQMTDAGYTISKFKVTSGSCYEIYGKDKAGKKVEIYSDPVTGKAVKSE